ncbi:MAG: hypothetical protein APF80_05100 [Alphaproteobacteria bacterium BRH_c36]|nr:MAG: hypothetical protein APF80_05100 [Alphaproteobacteria bacterium BRH_c36]
MTVGEYEAEASARRHVYTAGWFLKRLAIGILILVCSVGGLAWLTHAAIDPSLVEGDTLLDTIGRLTVNF